MGLGKRNDLFSRNAILVTSRYRPRRNKLCKLPKDSGSARKVQLIRLSSLGRVSRKHERSTATEPLKPATEPAEGAKQPGVVPGGSIDRHIWQSHGVYGE